MSIRPRDGAAPPQPTVEALQREVQALRARIAELTGGTGTLDADRPGMPQPPDGHGPPAVSGPGLPGDASGLPVAVLDALPTHVAVLDVAGRIQAVNEAWRRFGRVNGYADADFGVGRSYLHASDATGGAAGDPAVVRGLREVLSGASRAFAHEYPCHSPTEQRWYRMMAAPLGTDAAAGAVVMHLDISERVRAEAALRDSEQRYRAIVEVLPDAVFTVVGGVITFVNEAGLRLLRAPDADSVLLRTPASLFQPAELPTDGGFVEGQLLALDGGVVEVELAASRYEADGLPVVQVVCRDQTERRQAELQRRALSERLTHTLQSLSDSFCTVDRDWCVTYVNPAAERLLGRPATAVVGQSCWSLLPDGADGRIGEAMRRAMDTQGAEQLVAQVRPPGLWLDLRIYGSTQGLAVYARDVTKERRLALQLDEERQRLLQAQEVARMGSWATNLLSGEVSWSAQTHRIFETDPDGFQPTHERFLARVHPEDRAAVDAAFVASFEREEAQVIEHRLLFDDGRIKTVEERWQVFRGDDGAPVRALGTCQDITARKQAEQALRQSQALVDLAGHMARLGAWSVDLPSMAVHWSDVVAAIHGEPPGYTPPLDKALAYFEPAQRDTVWAHFMHCVEQGQPFDIETRLVAADGQRRWVRLIGQPERDATGRTLRVRGAVQDISERKAAEQATRALADRLMTTLESITDGFLLVDEAWRVSYVNRQGERMLQRERAQLLGRNLWAEFPEAEGGLAQQEYTRAVREQVATSFEYHFPPLGAWFEISAYPSEQGLAIYFRDVTQRKRDQDTLRDLNADLEARVRARTAELQRAREEAERASQAKSAFLAAMSHEIRTPMNGVIGMIDVLHQTSLQGYQVEMVDLIRDSAYSLLGVIEDILDFSKIEAQRMEIEQAPLCVADVVEGVCGMLDHTAIKRQVRVSMFVDPAIPRLLLGDEARLRQVLVNLVGNAIKFCGGRPQPGRVAVRVQQRSGDAQGSALVFSVADNGIGMDEATQARLFTPFTQGDASTTRRFGGTGLGLAICGTLVRLMGGRISVHSAPEQGATFTVELSLPRAPGEPPPATADALVAGLHCCLVGEDQPLAADLTAYLEAGGARVERAPALAQAVPAPLWVLLPSQLDADLDAVRERAAAAGGVRLLLLGSGHRRRPRMLAPDVVTIDHCGLTRRSLYRLLALASGRAGAEVVDEPQAGSGDLPAELRVVPPLRLQEGRRILVAEDNETNRRVIEQQIHLTGYDAEFAEDGRHALALWRSGDYALLFTDLHMPRMDGYALAEAIRHEERTRGLRRTAIVALTANALRDEELRCRAAGMDAYLSKPVRLARLKETIVSWLPALEETTVAMPADARAGSTGLTGLADQGAGDMPEHAATADSPSEPAPSSASGAQPHLDLSMLEDLVGNDAATVASLLRTFRDGALQSGRDMARALAHDDLRGVAEAAHKLKSGARSVGAVRLGARCEALEAAAEAGRRERMPDLARQFDAELQAVIQAATQRLEAR